MASARIRCHVAAIGLLGAAAIALLPRVTAASQVPPPRATGTHPLEVLPSGHPVVAVSLDGSEAKRFVIDTAASMTTILPKLRAELPGVAAKPSSEPLDGASGRTSVETAVVGRVVVAGHDLGSRDLMLLPPGPADRLGTDGILGADIIADFVVEIDVPGRRWRMTRTVEAGMLDGLVTSVPFVLDDQRAPRLSIRINGVEVPAVLDTGARGTIINWAAAKAIGLSQESPGLSRASDIRGATLHATASVEAKLDALEIGDTSAAGPSVRIADLPVFQAIGFGVDQPAAILGISALADRRFVIDHPGLRLHISPPVAASAS